MSRLSANLSTVGSVKLGEASPAAAMAVTQTTATAGGTGADAGGWSTAGLRDLAVTALTTLRTDILALDAEFDKSRTDIAEVRTALIALLDRLETATIITNSD